MADKRLFEQAIEASPAYAGLQQRIAFGKAGQATKNMTLQNLIDWLKIQLSTIFMQGANNLSDLKNKATSRSNLEVYGKSETFTQNEINNSINAVNNKFGGMAIALSGFVNSDGTYLKYSGAQPMTASKLGDGRYEVIHSLASNQYVVLATVVSSGGGQNKIGAIEYSNDKFVVNTGDDAESDDAAFRFIMFSFYLL